MSTTRSAVDARRLSITEELVRCIDERVRSDRRFAISDLSKNFQNISRSLLQEILTEHLHYKKLCSRWVPKTQTDVQKRNRMGAVLECLLVQVAGGRILRSGDVAISFKI
ncbi:hypothetical protein AVEN_171224-1 [Araneus ventricosus]|uniref:Uncharacterized protein n=1 Tax=Araneus ventricosus TaxID=182803 RepID=A0A4Y2TB75_ARAVE|nr:hypothetical protein AVEN_171224-1 [Araneus ventricosus]